VVKRKDHPGDAAESLLLFSPSVSYTEGRSGRRTPGKDTRRVALRIMMRCVDMCEGGACLFVWEGGGGGGGGGTCPLA
jgi:hypothetical protein